ncbi:MAG: DUF2892 domain-containing protein [Leptospiraceae bacterium]|nr:DUF2892 domain-containing protein [Leptospiraceae bacterium]
MNMNMGLVDRIIRVAVAALIGVLYYTGQISGTAAIILGVLALVFVATSLVGTCPLYLPLKISSKKKTA